MRIGRRVSGLEKEVSNKLVSYAIEASNAHNRQLTMLMEHPETTMLEWPTTGFVFKGQCKK